MPHNGFCHEHKGIYSSSPTDKAVEAFSFCVMPNDRYCFTLLSWANSPYSCMKDEKNLQLKWRK